jgi:hypothetical protein
MDAVRVSRRNLSAVRCLCSLLTLSFPAVFALDLSEGMHDGMVIWSSTAIVILAILVAVILQRWNVPSTQTLEGARSRQMGWVSEWRSESPGELPGSVQFFRATSVLLFVGIFLLDLREARAASGVLLWLHVLSCFAALVMTFYAMRSGVELRDSIVEERGLLGDGQCSYTRWRWIEAARLFGLRIIAPQFGDGSNYGYVIGRAARVVIGDPQKRSL